MSIALVIALSVLAGQDQPLGQWISTTADLGGVTAVAALDDGGFVVLDMDTSTLTRFDPEGEETSARTLASCIDPRGLATSGDRTFIADAGRDVVFVLEGDEVLAIGDHMALKLPSDVAAHAGRLAIADSGNDRIVLLDTQTLAASVIGGRGGEDGLFRSPTGVAFDDHGGLWVADTHNHRVQHFNADGRHVRSVGSWGSFPGQFIEPSGIDVRGDRVVVADRLNHRIQVLDTKTGEPLESWGMHAIKPRQGEGSVHYPSDVAVLASGDVIAVEPFEERLQRFGPSGTPVAPASRAPRSVQSHFGAVADTDGRFLVAWEPELRAIHVFDLHRKTPVRLSTFGRPGDAPGELGHITALLIDATSHRIVAIDAGNGRLHEWTFTPPPPDQPRFDPNMARLTRSIPLEHAGQGDLTKQDGDIVHMRRGTADAVVIGRDEPPHASPKIIDPITCDQIDTADGARLAILDLHGPQLHRYGFGQDDEPLDLSAMVSPADVAIASDGTVFIVDRGAHEVLRYDPDGAIRSRWGSRGIDHGQFWRPAAVVIDDQDRVIVLDHGNHRAQAFDLDGSWLITFGTGRAWTRDTLPFNHPMRATPESEKTP